MNKYILITLAALLSIGTFDAFGRHGGGGGGHRSGGGRSYHGGGGGYRHEGHRGRRGWDGWGEGAAIAAGVGTAAALTGAAIAASEPSEVVVESPDYDYSEEATVVESPDYDYDNTYTEEYE